MAFARLLAMRRFARALPILLAGCATQQPARILLGPSGQTAIEPTILSLHNAERARVGAAPLAWDPALSNQAAAYARLLALAGQLRHSGDRQCAGEHLWMGTAGAFPLTAIVGAWAAEKRYFRRGLFPNVSTTGNWTDVGHYTAMIWPTTTRIGCGLAVSGRVETLVCRYAPGGNIVGRRLP